MNEFHDGEGLEPVIPEETDSEELEVLRSWSDRLEAMRAEEVELVPELHPEPEPEPHAEPEFETQPLPVAQTEQRNDEDDVLESWSDRLEAFRASETEIVPETAPTQVLATPPV